jgi:hypothetical protein
VNRRRNGKLVKLTRKQRAKNRQRAAKRADKKKAEEKILGPVKEDDNGTG